MNIHAIEQRAGDLRHVALNLHWRTLALASGVIEKPTGMRLTMLHRGCTSHWASNSGDFRGGT
jgi:hypothetical protein